MKKLVLVIVIWSATFSQGCQSNDSDKIASLEKRIKKLEEKNGPELGLMMNQIQVYHTKLFFATKNNNRPLIDFLLEELDEQFESVVNVHKIHDNYPIAEIAETTILPALNDLHAALEKEDAVKLMERFDFVTITCNNCHKATNHAFIKIQNPQGSSYLDQDFL